MGATILRETDWLALREGTIGSSEAAAAIGESIYCSPYELWAQKLGMIPRPDISKKRSVRRGRAQEALALEEYEEETGFKLLDPRTQADRIEHLLTHDGAAELVAWVEQKDGRLQPFLRSTRYPWMTCTLDGVAVDSEGVAEIVEVKRVGFRQRLRWGDGENADAPREYRIQIDHDLIVCPAIGRAALFACIGDDDETCLIREDSAHPVFPLDAIVDLEHYFHQCVERREPPQIDSCAPESTMRALKALHPEDSGTTGVLGADALELHAQLQASTEQRLALDRQSAALEKNEKALKASLAARIAPHTFAELPNGAGQYEWRTHARKAIAATTYKQVKFIPRSK